MQKHVTTTMFKGMHHVAIITADYDLSKMFYTQILGFKVVREIYREERHSYKLDLQVSEHHPMQIELFSFPNPPTRPSRPEAAGARHIALAVDHLDSAISELMQRARENGYDLEVEPIRVDELTNERFTFFADPDGLPVELKEVADMPEWRAI